MCRLHQWWLVLVCALSVTVTLDQTYGANPFSRVSADTIDLGRRIFNHNWARPESWAGRETLGTGGDGLGPLFNEVSCVACHSQGGTGGSGDNNHNVQLLNVDLRSSPIISIRAQALDEAQTIHPGLSRSSSSVVLHHFGFGPQDDEYEYQQFRSNLLNRVEAMPARSVSTTAPRFSFELSQRSTPALWGLGLIESIRIDEGHKLRRELVRLQGLSQRGVSGRTPRTPTGEQGWYGWRGHVEDLKGFVVSACAVELGLEVPQRFQPDNPLYPHPKRTRPLDLDLTSPQVTALTAFIAQLPRPERIIPSDPYNRQAAEYGELVFHGIGCSECHVKTLGSVVDIYSDLLLHDMGPRISDQSPANPDSTPPASRTVSVRQGGSGYGGGGLMTVTVPGRKPVPTNVDQEWRTPPLWGSADSAPYLHDGRAETFHDAIEMHEGEASASAEEYRRLSDEQRSSLLSFLDTLRAPVTNNVE